MDESVTPLRALEIMRKLTRENVPFSIKYISLNETEKTSSGIREESDIFLAQGYRRDQSKKSETLVSFQRRDGQRRQFYWPLLCELNGRKVKP